MVKNVVIVGGGVAGAALAKTLQHHANATLIDPKEYFEIPWASLRAMVEPSFAERIVINHRDYLTKGDLMTILLSPLVTPNLSPELGLKRLNQYKAENLKIKTAHSILIVGGGPTGVELAGESAVDFPEKKLTLLPKGPRLLEFIGTKASRKMINQQLNLKSKKVEVKLEQSVNLNSVEDTDSIVLH